MNFPPEKRTNLNHIKVKIFISETHKLTPVSKLLVQLQSFILNQIVTFTL